MEFTSFLLTQDIDNVLRYIAQMSSNPEERQNFIEQLLTCKDPYNISKIDLIGSRSITSKIVETQLKAIGIENVENTDNNEEE